MTQFISDPRYSRPIDVPKCSEFRRSSKESLGNHFRSRSWWTSLGC